MKPAYIYIILGVLVASSRFFFEKYDQLLLISGMMLLILGIYSISKSLPSKKESDFQEPLVPKPPQNSEDDNEKATS
ncbi:hypothetical protein [Capnocytophaga sp.]|uniref:hypothetical protein n=1 Tax=Capnocytophaga sp. TaxID=44737 RepID=UPI0026DC9E0E|nr:hypothetical protein [Capnocytophaga sp.]MDO5105192.1 hypothetical protein [Capnocytophaga sp.]